MDHLKFFHNSKLPFPMSNTTQTGGLLKQRSLGGIFVHPLSLLTGGLAAVLFYVISSHEFTKENARHVINWYLSFLILFVVAFTLFYLGADEMTVGGETVEWQLLPEPIATIVALVGVLLLLVWMLAFLATLVFSFVGMVKAIFGTAWKYPLSLSIIGDDP